MDENEQTKRNTAHMISGDSQESSDENAEEGHGLKGSNDGEEGKIKKLEFQFL